MGRIVRNLLSVCVRRRMLIPRSRSAECLSAAENPTAEDLVPASLGPWEQGSGQFLGSERPEDLNATWPLLRTLTTGPHSQNGDHAARGGAKASAKADWKTETLLRLYSWLWAFRGASDLLPRTAIERHASRKKSSTSQPKTWLPSSRSIDGPDARIKARIIF